MEVPLKRIRLGQVVPNRPAYQDERCLKICDGVIRRMIVAGVNTREQAGGANETDDDEISDDDELISESEEPSNQAENEDFINKRGSLIDFLNKLQPDTETMTTSLFCCIFHHLNSDRTGWSRREIVRHKVLDFMVPAIIQVLKPSKLDGFGSIYPEDGEIFTALEKFYDLGIRIWESDQGMLYRQATPFECGNDDADCMDVMFTQTGPERYIYMIDIEGLGNRHSCKYCDKCYISKKNLAEHQGENGCQGLKILEQTGIQPDPSQLQVTEFICQQGIWKSKQNIMEKLKDLDILILPEHEGADESFLEKIDPSQSLDTPHYKFSMKHRAAMIAYTNSYDFETLIFESKPQNPSKFVEDFLSSVLECQQRISAHVRGKMQVYFDELQLRIDAETSRGRKYWISRYKSMLNQLNRYVDSVVLLGWNTSKYDIPVLRSLGFFYYLQQLDGPVHSLKKTGSKYIRVSSKHTVWLDFLLFQGPKVPLRNYLAQFDGISTDQDSMAKEYFPYGCLVSHDSLDHPLPPLESFYDSLKRRNQLLSNERMKFDQICSEHGGNQQLALAELGLENPPETPEEKYLAIRQFWENSGFKTVRDILYSYIRADVVPLTKAIQQSLHHYHTESIDLLKDFISLPSFVLHYALKFVPNPKDDFFCLLQREERDLLSQNLLGGPSLVFTRYCKVGVSRLNPHDFKNSPLAKRIIGFDQNSQYGGSMSKDMFVGLYAVRDSDTNFEPKLMGAKRHNAILYSEFFAFRNNLPYIRHIASSEGLGEKWIKLPRGLIRVDGYCSMFDSDGNHRKIVLEYHEEGYSHGYCESCQTPQRNAMVFHGNRKTMAELYEQTMTRMEEIMEAGYELHYIWECEFEQTKREAEFWNFKKYHFHLGPHITQDRLTEEEALQQIFTGDINGFVQLSANIAEKDRPYFDPYPVIFKHEDITRDMLVPKMQEYCKKYGLFESKQNLLISSFFAKNVLLSTTYVRFLQGLGVEFYGVKRIIQFRSSPCLAPYIRTMVQRRRKADQLKNPILSDLAKAWINNCFGYSIMNEGKRTVTKYKTMKQFERLIMNRSLVVDKIDVGLPDEQCDLVEVTVRPKKIKQKTPVQIGTEILFRGKVELLRFAYEIMKPNMKPDYYQFLLTDTDSVYLAIGSDSLAGCLKPGREKEWKKIEYDCFVDESTEARTLETKRTPLYWHTERESLGTMVM